MRCYRLTLLLPTMLLKAAVTTMAQSPVTLHGIVMDTESGAAISYATVALKSHAAGALTDTLGRFSFRATPETGDSLVLTYIGYATQIFALNGQPNQEFKIKMRAVTGALSEVVIRADPSPGKTLMKKVLAHNRENNPAGLQRIDARRWTRSEVDALDPVAALNPEKVLAGTGAVFGSRVRAYDKVRPDDDTLPGFTPLFFAEKLADYTLINHPFTENERVLAVKTTGLESDKILEPLARWDAGTVNLYESKVQLMGQPFVSPAGPDALSFYDFFITDSTALPNGHHAITLQPIPKVWHGNVFTGRITVEDSTYALTQADLRLSKAANLNFIDSLTFQQTFAPSFDPRNGRRVMMPKTCTITLRYEAGLELLGIPLPATADSKRLVSRMSTMYDNVRLNDPNGPVVTTGAMVTKVYSSDSGASDDFWKKARPDSLSRHEVAIYRMAAALRSDPQQRFKDKLFSTLGSGAYYIGDKVYLGPIGTCFSYNPIEGARFRVGFRTMEGLSKKVGVYGHLAYGTGDNQFKGSLGMKYLWGTQRYAKTELHASNDYDAVSQWYDEIDQDGFINSLLRKNVPYYQTLQLQLSLTHDQQLTSDWFVRGGVAYRTISTSFAFRYPNPDFASFDLTPTEPTHSHSIPVAEASLALRFAWHERSRIFNYDRLPSGSKFPSVALIYTRGFELAKADFTYQKLSFNIAHTTRITPKAALLWNLEGGKIFGTLPSLLLQVPRGNDTYIMSRYVYNTMLPYEFAADRYLSFQSRLALGGMLFDRVPLLQKLGWRERLSFSGFWGDLSAANRAFNVDQKIIAPNKTPFMEAGVGIENIFHLFSIDYMRRLSYLGAPGAKGNKGGVFLGMKVVF